MSQPPHGKLHSRGRPTASGKPSRHTPTMCTRHVSPGSCGTTHRPCGAPTPRTGHQPLGQVEPSCLASTADGSSDLAIIMPDKPPTCCLCSEKANSIFTEPTMDRCFQHGGELGERTAFGQGGRTASGQRESEKLKEEFVAFLPCGWNRRRFLHPCPAGCCGPAPCHDRAASVLKYRASPSHPRKKWTNMEYGPCLPTNSFGGVFVLFDQASRRLLFNTALGQASMQILRLQMEEKALNDKL